MNHGRGGYRGNNRRGVKDRGGRSVMQRMARQEMEDSPGGSGCFGGMRKGFLIRGGKGGSASASSMGPMGRLGLPIGGRRRGGPEVGWRKIIVVRGRQYGKEWIHKEIEEQIEEAIFPVHFKMDGPNAIFLMDDLDKVEAIRGISRRFSHPGTGNKVIINVEKASPPFAEVPEHEVEKIQEALSRRYQADTRHLDLSRLAQDEHLKFNEVRCFLQRNNYMMVVAKLIGEKCPNVTSIDVSENRLRFLDYFATLVYRARNVVRLNLNGNNVEKMFELEKLRGWRLLELELDGNPLCNAFASIPAYTSAIHSIFPKVARLDGVEVEPIRDDQFGLDEAVVAKPKPIKKAPPILPGFTVNAETKSLLETFIMEFFQIYDCSNPNVERQQLQPAYDMEATFTLILEPFLPRAPRFKNDQLFQEYRQSSHNIVNKERWENYRNKIVHHGNLNVVAKLCSLPKTFHVKESFFLDVSFFMPTMVCFSLQGLCWDGPDAEKAASGGAPDDEELRFFCRSFVATPRGAGISILNDMLVLSAAGSEIKEQYGAVIQQTLAAQMASAPVTPVQPKVEIKTEPGLPALPGPSTESHESLVSRFMAASGMKSNWAEKCLADNEWNFEKAGAMFQEMRGAIPPEAFQ